MSTMADGVITFSVQSSFFFFIHQIGYRSPNIGFGGEDFDMFDILLQTNYIWSQLKLNVISQNLISGSVSLKQLLCTSQERTRGKRNSLFGVFALMPLIGYSSISIKKGSYIDQKSILWTYILMKSKRSFLFIA